MFSDLDEPVDVSALAPSKRPVAADFQVPAALARPAKRALKESDFVLLSNISAALPPLRSSAGVRAPTLAAPPTPATSSFPTFSSPLREDVSAVSSSAHVKRRRTSLYGQPAAAAAAAAATEPVRRQPAPQPRPKEPRRQVGMLSMAVYVRTVVKQDAREADDKLRRARIFGRHEVDAAKRAAASAEVEGDARVRALLEALAWFDRNVMKRSKQQKQIHHALVILSLEGYYGDDLQEHIVRLLQKYRISEIRTDGLFTAPRRFGKTVSISMFAAAEIVTQPGGPRNSVGHDVLIYSNNQRASSLLLMHVYRFAKMIMANPRFGGKIVNLNKKESLEVQTREGYTNVVKAYPADSERLRGTGSTGRTSTVIGEELGYMPPDVVFQILGPILVRNRVKFAGITTINSSDNFLEPLAAAVYPHNGKHIMMSLNFDLVCDDCKKKGRALQCKCLAADIPAWQSAARHDKMAHLMKGNESIFLTEIKNVPINDLVTAAFNKNAVDWLRTPASIMNQPSLHSRVIYTAVDPAAGGNTSRFAIVSAIYLNDRFIIVGADGSRSDRPEDQAARLVMHMEAVRKLRGLETSRIVLCPESNLALEAKRIAQDLARERVRDVYCLREDVRRGEGVRMSEVFKKELAIGFGALLLQHRVRWHPQMVCVTSSHKDAEHFSPEQMRSKIIDQLAAYKKEMQPNKSNPGLPAREFYTGKRSGEDDHCIATQICFKSIELWHNNRHFYQSMRPLFDDTPFLSGA